MITSEWWSPLKHPGVYLSRIGNAHIAVVTNAGPGNSSVDVTRNEIGKAALDSMCNPANRLMLYLSRRRIMTAEIVMVFYNLDRILRWSCKYDDYTTVVQTCKETLKGSQPLRDYVRQNVAVTLPVVSSPSRGRP